MGLQGYYFLSGYMLCLKEHIIYNKWIFLKNFLNKSLNNLKNKKLSSKKGLP